MDLSNNPLTDKLVRQIGKIIRMQNEVLILNRHCEVAHENIFLRGKDLKIAEKNLEDGEAELLSAIEKLENAERSMFNKAKKVALHTAALERSEKNKQNLSKAVSEAKEQVELAKSHWKTWNRDYKAKSTF